jgi:hypothetical protein
VLPQVEEKRWLEDVHRVRRGPRVAPDVVDIRKSGKGKVRENVDKIFVDQILFLNVSHGF